MPRPGFFACPDCMQLWERVSLDAPGPCMVRGRRVRISGTSPRLNSGVGLSDSIGGATAERSRRRPPPGREGSPRGGGRRFFVGGLISLKDRDARAHKLDKLRDALRRDGGDPTDWEEP